MKKLTDLLPSALVGQEVIKAAKAQQVLRNWSEIVGGALATKISVVKYDHGTLIVEADGSAWAQEVQLHSETILARLNEAAEMPNLFKRIRVGSSR